MEGARAEENPSDELKMLKENQLGVNSQKVRERSCKAGGSNQYCSEMQQRG